MSKEVYIKLVNEKINNKAKKILLKQIERYYDAVNNYKPKISSYEIGDLVKLEKGTLLHGTYKNIEGLEKNQGIITVLLHL